MYRASSCIYIVRVHRITHEFYYFNPPSIFSIDISARMLDSPHPVILILHGSYRQRIFSIFDLLQNIAMRLKLCLVFIGYIRKR